MDTIKKIVKKILENSKGATLIEYILIASLVCIVMVAGMRKIGNGYIEIYNKIYKNVEGAGSSS